jgi:DNA-binding transcriptional ArsR family regulator
MQLPDAGDEVFRALADGTRRQILTALAEQPQSVGALAWRFPVSRPAISKHLKVLSDAGLVTVTPSGKRNFYAVSPDKLVLVAEWVGRFWAPKLGGRT